MHSILVCVGTDGDVFPFIGLGARLRARGHRVTLLANEGYRSLATEHGFAFHALVTAGESDEFLTDPDVWRPVKGALLAARWAVRFFRRQYDLLAAAASDGDAVLAASPGVFAARLVQEKLSIPMASVILMPWMIPSVSAPPVLPVPGLPRWAPRWAGGLYWRLVDATGDILIGRHLNRVRAALGLKPVRRLFRWWFSPELVIGLFPDW